MSKNITTARGGMFRVEDVTFHNARKQSEVAKELGFAEETSDKVELPTSLTPEQLIKYYKECADNTNVTKEKVAYSQTSKYLQEYLELKQKLLKYQTQEFIEKRANDKEEVMEVEE